jgi:hypothetical protein
LTYGEEEEEEEEERKSMCCEIKDSRLFIWAFYPQNNTDYFSIH